MAALGRPDENPGSLAAWAEASESKLLRQEFHPRPGLAIRAIQELRNSTDGKAGARMKTDNLKSRHAQRIPVTAAQGFHQARLGLPES